MMIDFEMSELIHRQIIIDLTIRTIERDRKHLSELKLNRPLEEWMGAKVNELQNYLRKIKGELGKKGVKIQAEKRVDEHFSEYEVLIRGVLENRRYANIALKNWVDEEVKRLLGMEHRTTDSGNANKTPPS